MNYSSFDFKILWTRISIHLIENKSRFEKDYVYSTNVEANLRNLLDIFDSVNSVSKEILDPVSKNTTDKLTIAKTEECLFVWIFNEKMLSRISGYLRCYCENFMLSDEDQNHRDLLLSIYNTVKNCPLLIENIFVDIFEEVTVAYVKNILNDHKQEFYTNVLDKILSRKNEFINTKVIPFLFPQTHNTSQFRCFFDDKFYLKIYFEMRLESIFEIVMDYPDSNAVLLDFSRCINVLKTGVELCEKLKSEIKHRLLHPAVATPDLITAYIAIIETLRLLDPTSVYEELVSPDIKTYLLNRDDGFKSIVDKILTMIEENDGCLSKELSQPNTLKVLSHAGVTEFGDVKCADNEMYDWIPDPMDNVEVRGLFYKQSDVLSLLLIIYSSKERFAEEYKNLLSQRLLKNMNFDDEKEFRNLETLKIRLGSQNLEHCDVMLKDIREARRINNTIHEKITESGIEASFFINSYVISLNYWPKMADKEIQLPNDLKSVFNQYTKHYSDYKRNRVLKYYHWLGTVDIEIELGGESVRMSVSSVDAIVIYCFTEKKQWEFSALAQYLKATQSMLRRSLNFWIQKEVVRRLKDPDFPETYALVESNDNTSKQMKGVDFEFTGDSDEEMHEVHAKEEELYNRLWPLVMFIIRNSNFQRVACDLDWIYNKIPTYSTDSPISISKENLECFLNSKVAENKIQYINKCFMLNPHG